MKKKLIPNQVWLQVLGSEGNPANSKRRNIIEVAIQIIATKGIESLTFESVGDKLATTKANIRYHFQNKDDLIFAAVMLVIANAQAITIQLVEKASTPGEKLNAILKGAYIWAKEYPDHFCTWAMYYYYCTIYTRYMKIFTEARHTGRSRLELLLRALPKQKNFKDEPKYNDLADIIQNLITGQLIGSTSDSKGHDDSLAQTEKLLKLILASNGIIWE